MKKISLLFIFALLASVVAHAELSQKALNMRTQLKSHIASMDLSPYIDEDGDIRFDYDGLKYYVHFQDFNDVVAVSIVKNFTNDAGLSNSKVDKICYDITENFLLVKVYANSKYEIIRVELEALYNTPAQVKELFYYSLVSVSSAARELLDRLNS